MADFPTTNGVKTFISPPDGYVLDFDNPSQSLANQHYALFAVGGFLAFLAISQRFYTKIFLSKGLQIDDGFMLLAWLASIASQAVNVWAIVIKSLGVHAWEMPLERYNTFSLAMYLSSPLYMLCNGFTKLSLLAYYIHLSPQEWFRWSVWATIGIVVTYTPVIFFLLIFACSPVAKSWDMTIQGGQCMDRPPLYIATAVTNIFTDIILFALPFRMVYGLRMCMRQKVAALFVFAVGSIDQTFVTAPASMWVFIEANLFVICGSMPTLRRFVKHVAPKLLGDSRGTQQQSAEHERARSSFTPAKSRSSKSKSSKSASSHAGQHYSAYNRLEEHDMCSLTTFLRNEPHTSATGTVEAGLKTRDDDEGSEKAIIQDTANIVQTKTFSVQFDSKK